MHFLDTQSKNLYLQPCGGDTHSRRAGTQWPPTHSVQGMSRQPLSSLQLTGSQNRARCRQRPSSGIKASAVHVSPSSQESTIENAPDVATTCCELQEFVAVIRIMPCPVSVLGTAQLKLPGLGVLCVMVDHDWPALTE
ncbi:MAG: hypothetical protein DCC65_08430 [Planctomycetota bacterium]|nr:MAG: hypothetical protein DCC65_08430 [Planctomycetota bacterium]